MNDKISLRRTASLIAILISLGLFTGMFDLTSAGIVSAIIFSFVFGLIFKARD